VSVRALLLVLTACSFRLTTTVVDGDAPSANDAPGDGVASDGDGGEVPDASTVCWPYAATNFEPCGLPPPIAVDLTGTTMLMFDTDAPPAAGVVRPQANGPAVVVIHLASLEIDAGASLVVTGSRPVILAVEGDVTISGNIVTRAGANDPIACGVAIGAPGTMSGSGPASGGGGGGASAASDGGDGGDGNNATGTNRGVHGARGASIGGTPASPLRGGCRGGNGGSNNGTGTPGAGGGGGGALQISARGSITSSSFIDAAGYSAGIATARTGGGGGGAGGTIFFEAPTVTVSGRLCADGGAGSEGGGGLGSGGAGGRSPCTGATGALGGNSTTYGGNAGGGGHRNNVTGGTGGPGGNDGTYGGGGGGGGGGVGWIRLRAVGGSPVNGAVTSPAPTLN